MMRIKKLLILYFKHLLFTVRVGGESMWPALIPGRKYLATNLLQIRKGDFAVFRNPSNPSQIFVKKIAEICGEKCEMKSLISWGISSMDFGDIQKQNILGKLLRFNLPSYEVRPRKIS